MRESSKLASASSSTRGTGSSSGQHLPAHRKAHRQVELIRRALGQGQRPAGRQAAGLRRQRLKLTGEGDLAVFAAGKTGEDLPRRPVQLR